MSLDPEAVESPRRVQVTRARHWMRALPIEVGGGARWATGGGSVRTDPVPSSGGPRGPARWTWCVRLTSSVRGSRRKSGRVRGGTPNRSIMNPYCREGEATPALKEGGVVNVGPALARSGVRVPWPSVAVVEGRPAPPSRLLMPPALHRAGAAFSQGHCAARGSRPRQLPSLRAGHRRPQPTTLLHHPTKPAPSSDIVLRSTPDSW